MRTLNFQLIQIGKKSNNIYVNADIDGDPCTIKTTMCECTNRFSENRERIKDQIQSVRTI